MVDRSLPKLMHKIFKDALCIHVSVDGYLWSGFNSAELCTVATLIAPYGGVWQVGLKKADNNILSNNLVGRISLNTILSVMSSNMKEIQASMFLYLIRLPLGFNFHLARTVNRKISKYK
ncbi:hypothetical protein CFP56_039294 [Quercus suber]|uniref:Uncharacterized protein n=1 Tax=Quercus suber TaxID=58331 RepID=A0AAW0J0G2_QUESU